MAEGLKRGDLIIVSLPGDYGKPRPAVIVQEIEDTPLETVVICPLTSTLIAAGPVRPTITPATANGLVVTSQVMVDKITTTRIEKAGRRIGALSSADLEAIDLSLAKLLGLRKHTGASLG